MRSRIASVLVLASACGASPPAPTNPPTATNAEPPAAAPAPPPAPKRPPGVKQYDAATMFKNVSVIAAGFSHDGGKALVSTDASGVFNLYAIPTAGGEPERL